MKKSNSLPSFPWARFDNFSIKVLKCKNGEGKEREKGQGRDMKESGGKEEGGTSKE